MVIIEQKEVELVEQQEFVNKRKVQYQQTLEKIRSAVDKLVEQKGFAAMTIRDICSEAGIKTGGFYHHFSSKDELLFDRYRRTNQYFTALYETRIQGMQAIEGLHLVVDAYFAYLKSRVLSVMLQYHITYTANRSQWQAREPEACLGVITRLMQQGVESGEMAAAARPQDLTDFLWCLIRGATERYCATSGSFLQQSGIEQMIHQWIDSLAADAGAQ